MIINLKRQCSRCSLSHEDACASVKSSSLQACDEAACQVSLLTCVPVLNTAQVASVRLTSNSANNIELLIYIQSLGKDAQVHSRLFMPCLFTCGLC